MSDDLNIQRIPTDQGLLFSVDPRELAEAIGLDWWAAKKLYDDGWLSFDPYQGMITDASSEAEFVFLGSLVAAGCDPYMLKRLLSGVPCHYEYKITDIYFDWLDRKWRALPQIPDAKDAMSQLLDQMEGDKNVEALTEILEDIQYRIRTIEEKKDPVEDDSC